MNYHQFLRASSSKISDELCLSPDGISRAIIRFPRTPLLLEVPRVITVYNGLLLSHRGEGIMQIMYLLTLLINYSTSQLQNIFLSFPSSIIWEGNHISDETEKPSFTIWERIKLPKTCGHVLLSTLSITSRNIIGSKNAIQYGTESHGPPPASRYLSRSPLTPPVL